jgi:hypothetical protein
LARALRSILVLLRVHSAPSRFSWHAVERVEQLPLVRVRASDQVAPSSSSGQPAGDGDVPHASIDQGKAGERAHVRRDSITSSGQHRVALELHGFDLEYRPKPRGTRPGEPEPSAAGETETDDAPF